MIFNEQGFIDIDEMIAKEPSFRKIMADGVVTSDELREQTNQVMIIRNLTTKIFGHPHRVARLFCTLYKNYRKKIWQL